MSSPFFYNGHGGFDSPCNAINGSFYKQGDPNMNPKLILPFLSGPPAREP